MKTYSRELDGLRGIAVFLVASFHIVKRASIFTDNEVLHFFLDLSRIGWIGVDIFFALSGFLITSILLNTKNEENYFKNFYARRIFRIFPLYYFTLFVVLFFVPRLEPEFTENLHYVLPIMLLYLQNWILFFNINWIPQSLGITWSLAIEEQFYLIWPLFVKRLSKEKLLKFILAYISLSITIQTLVSLFFKDAVNSYLLNYSSFSRFEELLWGGLLAIWLTYDGALEKLRKIAKPMFVVPFILFILLWLAVFPDTPSPLHANPFIALSGYTLIVWFSLGLISIFITQPPQDLLRRFFGAQVLVSLGKYSYSIYLFHAMVTIILFDLFWYNGFRGWEFFFLHIILSYIVTMIIALLTWHLLEKHMLYLKKYFEYEKRNMLE